MSVTDVILVEGRPGLVMEYVRGPTLGDWLDHNQPNLAQAEALFLGILSGVARAHRDGLVHRDLKPSNVLLCEVDEGVVPMVTDFGLAKVVNDATSGVHTRSGMMMGTPAYMAPEQVQDAATVDARADIFALGCVLYEMVCGRPPFDGPDPLSIFGKLAIGDYVPPEALVPTLPERFRRTIRACLHRDRELRVKDCRSLRLLLVAESEAEVEAGQVRPVPLSEGRTATIHQTLEPAAAKPATDSATQAWPSRAAETLHPGAFMSVAVGVASPAPVPWPATASGTTEHTPVRHPTSNHSIAPRSESATGSLAPSELPTGFSWGSPTRASGTAVPAIGCAVAVALSGMIAVTGGGAAIWALNTRSGSSDDGPATMSEPAPLMAPNAEQPAPAPAGDADEQGDEAKAQSPVVAPETAGSSASAAGGAAASGGSPRTAAKGGGETAPVATPKPAPGSENPTGTPKPTAPDSPPTPTTATWTLAGDADTAWLSAGTARFGAGPVAPGEYTIHARFGQTESEHGRITLRAGDHYTVKCAAAFQICKASLR